MFHKGDRIRVTEEGLLTDQAGEHLRIGGRWIHPSKAARVEVIRKAEEVPYRDDGVYQDANGDVWQYDKAGHGWWMPGINKLIRFGVPRRPLRLLTPEGRLSAWPRQRPCSRTTQRLRPR
jgi:hypothetical protein